MAENLGHLELPFRQRNYQREKPPRFPKLNSRTDREKKDFLEVQVQQFGTLNKTLAADKAHYEKYLDPNLIFKLEVNQSVSEDSLRTELLRMNISVLSPSPDKKGLWVVFAENGDVQPFQDKLQLYAEGNKYKFFNAIGGVAEIPTEEKIGERLLKHEIGDNELAYLDVEIWRMNDDRLEDFVNGLTRLVETEGGKVCDKLIKETFCLIRIRTNKPTLNELLPLREIASVDRPPKPYIEYTSLALPLEAMSVGTRPREDATAIAVLDSGILSNHPLLRETVGDEIAVGMLYSDKVRADKPHDDVGHGTKVAGIAAYGDITECINDANFQSQVWILSAKVMYGEKDEVTGKVEPKYDEEELLEHQLETAVRYFAQRYANCKVVNLSLGDEAKAMLAGRRQFNLASLVDELARELKLIFVISTGNFRGYQERGYPDNYPDYLLEESQDAKIIDPATAVLGITVGSIAHEYGPLNRFKDEIPFSPAKTNYPSPFTRVGPGYKGSIKPEVVEVGGNIIVGKYGLPDSYGKVAMLNPKWLEGKLFTLDSGSSFSAPKVANIVARLINEYPNYSHNLIKALLISSAAIPLERPVPLALIDTHSPDSKFLDVLKVYGYGKPAFEKASSSSANRAMLVKDNRIQLDSVHVYHCDLPDIFANIPGEKRLSISVVYDPPVNKNRVDYMGCSLEFHLFKDMDTDEIAHAYGAIKLDLRADEVVPEKLKAKEINLRPGVNLRKRGVHQKGMVEYKGKPRIDISKPLVIAVVCQNRWIRDTEFLQDYAIVVTIEHSANLDLFNEVRVRNQERIRVTL